MHRHEDDPLEPDDAGEPRAEPRPPRRSGPDVRVVLAVVLAIVLIAFAAVNFRPVRVNFLLFTTRARVVTVIAVAALLGVVVGWFVGRPSRDERRLLRERRAARDRDER